MVISVPIKEKGVGGQIIPRLFHHEMATPHLDICKSVADEVQMELKFKVEWKSYFISKFTYYCSVGYAEEQGRRALPSLTQGVVVISYATGTMPWHLSGREAAAFTWRNGLSLSSVSNEPGGEDG